MLRVSMVLCGLLSIGCASAPVGPRNVAAEVAYTYGLGEFDRLHELEFTFIAELPDRRVERAWTWWPKLGEVTRRGPGEPLRFRPDEIGPNSTEEERTAHEQFVNDSYWFLFPFHLAWDQGALFRVDEREPEFETAKTRRRIVVTYGQVGYTPGDVYQVFVDRRGFVVAWAYHRGGAEEPTRQTRWEGLARLGPFHVSLHRVAPEGDFRVSFEDVRARVEDGDEMSWVLPDVIE